MTMDGPVQNANPVIYETQIVESSLQVREDDYNESVADPIAAAEIFDLIRAINDPEHPLSLEQLNVVRQDHVDVTENHVLVEFTPTIPHCSMATLIGLSIRVKLLRSLPQRLKVTVRIRAGTHQSEAAGS